MAVPIFASMFWFEEQIFREMNLMIWTTKTDRSLKPGCITQIFFSLITNTLRQQHRRIMMHHTLKCVY